MRRSPNRIVPMSTSVLWSQFGPWIAAGWFAYLALLATWIVLQKREPIATLSWVLSLALLPVVGFLIYHFLGPTRIERQRVLRTRARHHLKSTLPPELVPSEDCKTVARLAQTATGYAASTATHVDLLVGGETTFDAQLAAVAAAKHHVHLEYYIFEPDRSGTQLRDALVERARAGVRVRLLLDAIGARKARGAFLAPLRDAGGEIAWFHPPKLAFVWRPRVNLRNHRKLIVVDGAVAFTGGINITDDQDLRLSAEAFHDLHLRVEGEVVRWLQVAFLEDWTYATDVALRDPTLWPTPARGRILAQAVPSGPDSPWEAIHRVHVEAIHQADRRIWLMTPYFVPGEAARMALVSAAMRGLDVRVLVPVQGDSALVSAAARSYFDELVRGGVRVFEYQPRMLHGKALLIDDDTLLLGSANFDPRSFRLNFELAMLLGDAALARRFEQVMADCLALATEVTAGAPKAPLPRRLAEAWARLLSPVL